MNLSLSHYIDTEQAKAQKVYPHFFEKHVTDGVDHSIYIGKALVPGQTFHMSYVHNLRLWQLDLVCGLARIAHQVSQSLPVKLKTSQLIVAQESPMSIEFRYDEKRFDVRGAYNIRYELIKKRIDKATISGSGERLTEPGTVSVVFSQESERREYEVYFHYLTASGVLESKAEVLDLEELQDVTGLRALRGQFSRAFLESALSWSPKRAA
ncbi:MAG: hypothetical protein NTY08_17390 [Proteobacteria bacterium]|nr:hypothetical protein [Pseudomonadota bacterium]